MNRRSAYLSRGVSILGLIVVLGAAWGFDAWMAFLGRGNSQTFSLSLGDFLVISPDRLIVGSYGVIFGLVCA